MAAMTRRPLLKRIALWTAAVVLLLVAYLAGAPIAVMLSLRHFPRALPVLKIAYYPLDSYLIADLPGSTLYIEYARWVQRSLKSR
jgi:hypothetical protein